MGKSKTLNEKNMTVEEARFIISFDNIAKNVHENAIDKGWHDGKPKNQAELIALMHSELSEALEALRHNNPPSDHIPAFSGVEEELADVIIRIMDMAIVCNLDISGAIIEKMKFNKNRSYRHGGKKF